MDRVIFFGAGTYAQNRWKQLLKQPFFTDQYIAFSDNNSELWGQTFQDLKIIPPLDLKGDMADIFVITSSYDKEIKQQLVHEIGVAEDKVYLYDEYKKRCYTRWQYNKRYGNLPERKNGTSAFNLKSVVVYTAIIGGYDDLHDPLFTDDGLTYICFTDNRELKSDIWNIEYIRDARLDSIHLARKLKVLPHLYLKEFDTSMWIDGNFEINQDIRSYIQEYERDRPMLCFPHCERECIYEEAGTCLYYKKGNKEDIIKQVNQYYQDGYPFNNGLYETGCIVRDTNNELVKKIMEDWYQEIFRYSYRDQLSLPIVCHSHAFEPDICDLNIYDNRWIKVHVHNC